MTSSKIATSRVRVGIIWNAKTRNTAAGHLSIHASDERHSQLEALSPRSPPVPQSQTHPRVILIRQQHLDRLIVQLIYTGC